MLRLRKGVAKFGGKKPNKAAIKLPLRDGDIERDDEALKRYILVKEILNKSILRQEYVKFLILMRIIL